MFVKENLTKSYNISKLNKRSEAKCLYFPKKIDDETYEKIEELVKQNKTSVSLEIRKMIDFYLESKERLEK